MTLIKHLRSMNLIKLNLHTPSNKINSECSFDSAPEDPLNQSNPSKSLQLPQNTPPPKEYSNNALNRQNLSVPDNNRILVGNSSIGT